MKKTIITILGFLLPMTTFAAAPVIQVFNGGTGSSTLSGILNGNGTSMVRTTSIGDGLTYSGTTLFFNGGATSNSWKQVSGLAPSYLTPTTTPMGILVNSATSTITNLFTSFSTSTNATTTNLFSTTASSTNLFSALATLGSNALLVTSGGHTLLGGLTTDGTGVLQFASATTNSGGLAFGTDNYIYRLASGVNVFQNTTAGLQSTLKLMTSDGSFGLIGRSNGSNQIIGGDAAGDTVITGNRILLSSGALSLTLDAAQLATFAGGITSTAAPIQATTLRVANINNQDNSVTALTIANTTGTSNFPTIKVGVGSTTPFAAFSVGGGNGSSTKAILSAEDQPATSTSMTVDWNQGNTTLIRIGNAAVTISFTNFTDGGVKKVLTCNPPTGTAGTVTWGTQVLWAGGTAPSQTTTATHCDVWSFIATQATSTLKIFGAQTANF